MCSRLLLLLLLAPGATCWSCHNVARSVGSRGWSQPRLSLLLRTAGVGMAGEQNDEASALEERLVKEILAQAATGKEWDPSMVTGMESDLARVNELRADDNAPVSAGLPRSGVEPWGTWSQSADSVYLELHVDGATRAADVRCECLVGFLDVRCSDEPVLSGRLAQQVLPTELSWALDEGADGGKLLCVELPKREASGAVDSAGCFADALFSSLRVGSEEILEPGLVSGRVLE